MAPYGTLLRNYVRNALAGHTPDGRELADPDTYTPEYRAWLQRQAAKNRPRRPATPRRTFAQGNDPESP